MIHRRFRHLPVTNDNGRLIGIFTIGDVVKRLIPEQDETIRERTGYVDGTVKQKSSG